MGILKLISNKKIVTHCIFYTDIAQYQRLRSKVKTLQPREPPLKETAFETKPPLKQNRVPLAINIIRLAHLTPCCESYGLFVFAVLVSFLLRLWILSSITFMMVKIIVDTFDFGWIGTNSINSFAVFIYNFRWLVG